MKIRVLVWLSLAVLIAGLVLWESFPHHHHPIRGPHGGELATWGDEAFHLEFVSEGEQATVYVLDRWAKRRHAIESESIEIEVESESPLKIQLKAVPDADDPPGKSSRFIGAHEVLRANAKRVRTIRGVALGESYSGVLGDR